MQSFQRKITRRDWLKAVTAAGLGSVLARRAYGAADAVSGASAKTWGGKMPTRPFGKTGADVSILSIGGMFDIGKNQLLMKQALDWGVTYWDTADCYNYGGPTEAGIGKFFASHPEARKQVFLATKSDKRDPAGMSELLRQSLSRLNTDHVDLYEIHGVGSIEELTPRMRSWAEQAKADGKIRFFGFSCHQNMEVCLKGAATLGWVDGIMFSYNYRFMDKRGMREAVEACHKAGIGLTAMKTQGGGQVHVDSERELRMAGRFMEKGFTQGQAKLKAIWDDPRIAAICSQMPNMNILMSNVAAALDKTKLDRADLQLLQEYAQETCGGYCAGCGSICSAAVGGRVPVSDVMRCLMYRRSYGDYDLARSEFLHLPAAAREALASTDYAAAERACPHALPIARLMREAADLLA